MGWILPDINLVSAKVHIALYKFTGDPQSLAASIFSVN